MLTKREYILIFSVIAVMLVYFVVATPIMTDDGFQYEGFTESLAHGKLNFKSFYGFQGLSFFAVPIFWLTRSHNSIIIMSIIFSLLSVPLAYSIGKTLYQSSRAGIYFLILFLLTPYPYTTMMRGFQEAALLFFILLIIYSSLNKKVWTPVAWAIGGIVKPFALVLFPLFIKNFFPRTVLRKDVWVIIALAIGLSYLGASYYQTGHLINNAAINSYQGDFDTGNPPPLVKSFTIGIKGPLRIGANLFLAYRKIMVSPFLILIGLWMLWKDKNFKYRNAFIYSIALNFLLLSLMTFSFSKYLLPATTLISFAAVPFIMKYKWAMLVFLIDSITVFLPIWNFFGHAYWSNIYVYFVPFYLGIILFVYDKLFAKHNFNTNS